MLVTGALHFYLEPTGALVIRVTRHGVPVSLPVAVTVEMTFPVRTAYRRQETVLSRGVIVLALGLQGPHAGVHCGAEVDSWSTLPAYRLPAGVALHVVVAVSGVREVVLIVCHRVQGARGLWPRGAVEVRAPPPAMCLVQK